MTPVIFINCKEQPFLDRILSGQKKFETRTRNTLGRFLDHAMNDRVLLAETGHGRPVIRAVARINCSVAVFSQLLWDAYLPDAGIDPGSSYDWQPDTKVKWLYHLTDVQAVVPFQLPADALRHGRTWAECDLPYETISC